MRDEQNAHSILFLKIAEQCQNLRLDRHVKCSRRLVGDKQLRTRRKRHGDHDALSKSSGELMGVGAVPQFGTRDAHFSEESDYLVTGGRPAETLMTSNRFADLLAGTEEWVEERHRVLEDHRDPAAAKIFHFAFAQRCQILATEENLARNVFAW